MVQAANLTTELHLGDTNVTLRIKHNPRARRMILKIDHTSGEVHVTAPTKKSMKDAPGFVAREEVWVKSKLAQLPQRQAFIAGATIPLQGTPTPICHHPERRRGVWHDRALATLGVSGDTQFVPRRVHDWLRREARRLLVDAVAVFTQAQSLALPKITIHDTTTRWGSCSSSGALSFSWRLILAPDGVN